MLNTLAGGIAIEQTANVAPPRRGKVIALAVDATARPYDISALSLAGSTSLSCIVALQAQTASVFYYFAPATANDLDPAAVISAGGAIAYANTFGVEIPAGATHEVRIDRTLDLFLVVRTSSATATLRLWAASEAA